MPATLTSLPFLQRFRPLAYILVLLAIAGAAYAEANAPLFLLGTLGTFISWILVERPRGAPLPRALINVGVLAASCGLFYELVLATHDDLERGHPTLLLALSHFMVAILMCKLFERKSNRDYAQILTLTLLVMVAGAIVATSSLFFAIILAAYLGLGLYAILLFHLRTETQRALDAAGSAGEIALLPESFLTMKRDIRLVVAAAAALLLVVATAVFLLFPRASAQDFFQSLAGSTTTGFSDRVRMKEFVHLHQSETVVMQVSLEQNGVNIGSETFQPYFRGLVLDTYDSSGKQWIHSVPREMDEDYTLPGNAELDVVAPDKYNALGVITQTYTMQLSASQMHAGMALFSLAPPVSIASASEQLKTVTFSPHDMVLATRGSAAVPFTYVTRSPVIGSAALFDDQPTITPGDLGQYRVWMPQPDGSGRESNGDRMVPGILPQRVDDLAHSLVQDLLPKSGQPLDPLRIRQIADRFQDYLLKNYVYSLDFKSVDRHIDPTEDFLLNRKTIGGNCEFFASAMVMMCRAVGVNARMATGYRGGEFNSIGGFYVVKQKFAHAWVEVFLPHRGWTIYDPSPAADEPTPASSIARWFHEVSEVLQKAWLSTVVAFDNTSRNYLFNSISTGFEQSTQWLNTTLAHIAQGLRELFIGANSPWWLRTLAFGSMAAILALFIWLVRGWHRRRTSQIARILRGVDRKMQRQLAHDLIFFDELLRILARTGPKKLPEQTPLEYVEKLSPLLRAALADARWLIAAFYDIRFGAVRVDGNLRSRIDHALARVRAELQHPV